jgi:uncharacterized protein YecE (DUF72 family)
LLRLHGRATPDFGTLSGTDSDPEDQEPAVPELVDQEIDWASAWRWQYSPDELETVAQRVRDLASASREVHVLFTNVYRSDAANAAEALQNILQSSQGPNTK